jgi:hypothetical protein
MPPTSEPPTDDDPPVPDALMVVPAVELMPPGRWYGSPPCPPELLVPVVSSLFGDEPLTGVAPAGADSSVDTTPPQPIMVVDTVTLIAADTAARKILASMATPPEV